MVYAVYGANLCNIERIDTVETSYVVAKFGRRRPALMMCVYTANGAKVVLCSHGVELIEAENFLASYHAETSKRHGSSNGSLTTANRTIAAPRINDSIAQLEFENHRTAMT
jgi:hypothetical protein